MTDPARPRLTYPNFLALVTWARDLAYHLGWPPPDFPDFGPEEERVRPGCNLSPRAEQPSDEVQDPDDAGTIDQRLRQWARRHLPGDACTSDSMRAALSVILDAGDEQGRALGEWRRWADPGDLASEDAGKRANVDAKLAAHDWERDQADARVAEWRAWAIDMLHDEDDEAPSTHDEDMREALAERLALPVDHDQALVNEMKRREAPVERECERCDGCGQIASGEEGAPWSFWLSLPPGSDLAVRMGIVKPLTCPVCNGAKVVRS